MRLVLFFGVVLLCCYCRGESTESLETINILVDRKNPSFQLNIITDPDDVPDGENPDVRIESDSRVFLPQFQDARDLIPEVKRQFETALEEMAKEAKSEIELHPEQQQKKRGDCPGPLCLKEDEEKKLQEDVKEMFEEMTNEMDWQISKKSGRRRGRNKITEDDKEEELRKNLAEGLQMSVKQSIDNSGLDEESKNRLSSMLRQRMSRVAGTVIGKILVKERKVKQKRKRLENRLERKQLRKDERQKKDDEDRRDRVEKIQRKKNQNEHKMKFKWKENAEKMQETSKKRKEEAEKRRKEREEKRAEMLANSKKIRNGALEKARWGRKSGKNRRVEGSSSNQQNEAQQIPPLDAGEPANQDGGS